MHQLESILILVFLILTFVFSCYEKIFDWKNTLTWLKNHFAQTWLKNQIPLALIVLIVFEFISSVLCVLGIINLLKSNSRIYGFYGAVFSSITLLLMLFGQRLVKDYDGARTIVIYFIPTLMAVHWLS